MLFENQDISSFEGIPSVMEEIFIKYVAPSFIEGFRLVEPTDRRAEFVPTKSGRYKEKAT
jgi:hypothetical protein